MLTPVQAQLTVHTRRSAASRLREASVAIVTLVTNVTPGPSLRTLRWAAWKGVSCIAPLYPMFYDVQIYLFYSSALSNFRFPVLDLGVKSIALFAFN